jgi:hypothetical protein
MTVSTERISTRMDGGTLFAEVNTKTTDTRIPSTPFSSSQIVGGSTEVSTTSMGVTQHDAVEGDSSRKLAEGELPIRSIGGMALSSVEKADPSKVVVTVNGIEIQLSEATKLGLVEVQGNKVVARTPAKAAQAPAAPRLANLGPEWEQVRRENPSADNLLAAVLSAVGEGKRGPALSAKLEDWDRQMNLGCDNEEQVVNIVNGLANRLHEDIAKDVARMDSRVKPSEAFEVVDYIFNVMSPAERTSLLIRKLHGDQSYLKEFNRILNRQIRKESDLAASKTKK